MPTKHTLSSRRYWYNGISSPRSDSADFPPGPAAAEAATAAERQGLHSQRSLPQFLLLNPEGTSVLRNSDSSSKPCRTGSRLVLEQEEVGLRPMVETKLESVLEASV